MHSRRVPPGLKSGVHEISRRTAFSIARTDEALLRITPAKLNYEPKKFFAEIGASAWSGVIAQSGAHSNTDANAEETVFFSF